MFSLPGFRSDLQPATSSRLPDSRALARAALRRKLFFTFARNPAAISGSVLVGTIFLTALLAPAMISSPAAEGLQVLADRLSPPSQAHWFGTDDLGRDIFGRVVMASRVSLLIIALVSALVLPIGVTIGMTAGYLGGWVDNVLMRITDIVLAFPRLILALALAAALGPGLDSVVLAIALTSWPIYARVARSETQTIRNSDFIVAARLQGASTARILVRHILPFCLPSTIVRLTLDMAGIILTAAGLGFLGLGIQPPAPEWGAMVAAARQFLADQWWMSAFPGAAILLTSLGFNLIGDALRDTLEPRSP